MATKRNFAAWAAIVILSFDIAAEVARLGVCIVKPDPRDVALCADPIGPVSRLIAQMIRMLAVEGTPPVEQEKAAPPPVVVPKGGSTMEQMRKQPTL